MYRVTIFPICGGRLCSVLKCLAKKKLSEVISPCLWSYVLKLQKYTTDDDINNQIFVWFG